MSAYLGMLLVCLSVHVCVSKHVDGETLLIENPHLCVPVLEQSCIKAMCLDAQPTLFFTHSQKAKIIIQLCTLYASVNLIMISKQSKPRDRSDTLKLHAVLNSAIPA